MNWRGGLWILLGTLLWGGGMPGARAQDAASIDAPIESATVWTEPGEAVFPWYEALPWNPPLSLQVEYIRWWLSGNSVPELATTAPLGSAPVLGGPDTQVLFGGDQVDGGGRAGVRATLTARLAEWFDTDLALEGHLILLGNGQSSGDFTRSSSGSPQLAIPFFNAQSAAQDAFLVAHPNLTFFDPLTGFDPSLSFEQGHLEIRSSSEFDAAGLVFRRPWTDAGDRWLDLLAGYRYLQFEEATSVMQWQRFRDANNPGRTASLTTEDRFQTFNQFHGIDLGAEMHWQHGPLTFRFLTKLAVGNLHQTLDITGGGLTVRPEDNNPATPQFVADDFGVLAGPSNIGQYERNHVTVVPEIGITLRRFISVNSALTLGYTLMAVPNVLRSGDQIDTTIDPSQTVSRPSASLRDSVLWIQGINVGLEF